MVAIVAVYNAAVGLWLLQRKQAPTRPWLFAMATAVTHFALQKT